MRTVFYFDWQDLTGLIPEDYAIEALDDDRDGTPEMWEVVRAAACDAVDGYLEGRYDTPLVGEPPSLVKRSAVLFAAHDCFARRQEPDRFPHSRELGSRVKTLEKIRDGETQLVPGKRSRKPRGAVLSEPSRVHGSGRLSS